MSEAVKIFKWGEHPMTLRHPWVRSYLRIRGLPGAGGSTPADCYQRFCDDRYSIEDTERVFIRGLIGGGLTMSVARAIVTQAQIDAATAAGVAKAVAVVRKELDAAQKEVDSADKPGSKFSAGNRERAILRRDVAKKIFDSLSKL